MYLEDVGTAATEAAGMAADTLDRIQPGWWNMATAEDLAGSGGDLYTVACSAACGYEIERRKAVDRKMAELSTTGFRIAKRVE